MAPKRKPPAANSTGAKPRGPPKQMDFMDRMLAMQAARDKKAAEADRNKPILPYHPKDNPNTPAEFYKDLDHRQLNAIRWYRYGLTNATDPLPGEIVHGLIEPRHGIQRHPVPSSPYKPFRGGSPNEVANATAQAKAFVKARKHHKSLYPKDAEKWSKITDGFEQRWKKGRGKVVSRGRASEGAYPTGKVRLDTEAAQEKAALKTRMVNGQLYRLVTPTYDGQDDSDTVHYLDDGEIESGQSDTTTPNHHPDNDQTESDDPEPSVKADRRATVASSGYVGDEEVTPRSVHFDEENGMPRRYDQPAQPTTRAAVAQPAQRSSSPEPHSCNRHDHADIPRSSPVLSGPERNARNRWEASLDEDEYARAVANGIIVPSPSDWLTDPEKSSKSRAKLEPSNRNRRNIERQAEETLLALSDGAQGEAAPQAAIEEMVDLTRAEMGRQMAIDTVRDRHRWQSPTHDLSGDYNPQDEAERLLREYDDGNSSYPSSPPSGDYNPQDEAERLLREFDDRNSPHPSSPGYSDYSEPREYDTREHMIVEAMRNRIQREREEQGLPRFGEDSDDEGGRPVQPFSPERGSEYYDSDPEERTFEPMRRSEPHDHAESAGAANAPTATVGAGGARAATHRRPPRRVRDMVDDIDQAERLRSELQREFGGGRRGGGRARLRPERPFYDIVPISHVDQEDDDRSLSSLENIIDQLWDSDGNEEMMDAEDVQMGDADYYDDGNAGEQDVGDQGGDPFGFSGLEDDDEGPSDLDIIEAELNDNDTTGQAPVQYRLRDFRLPPDWHPVWLTAAQSINGQAGWVYYDQTAGVHREVLPEPAWVIDSINPNRVYDIWPTDITPYPVPAPLPGWHPIVGGQPCLPQGWQAIWNDNYWYFITPRGGTSWAAPPHVPNVPDLGDTHFYGTDGLLHPLNGYDGYQVPGYEPPQPEDNSVQALAATFGDLSSDGAFRGSGRARITGRARSRGTQDEPIEIASSPLEVNTEEDVIDISSDGTSSELSDDDDSELNSAQEDFLGDFHEEETEDEDEDEDVPPSDNARAPGSSQDAKAGNPFGCDVPKHFQYPKPTNGYKLPEEQQAPAYRSPSRNLGEGPVRHPNLAAIPQPVGGLPSIGDPIIAPRVPIGRPRHQSGPPALETALSSLFLPPYSQFRPRLNSQRLDTPRYPLFGPTSVEYPGPRPLSDLSSSSPYLQLSPSHEPGRDFVYHPVTGMRVFRGDAGYDELAGREPVDDHGAVPDEEPDDGLTFAERAESAQQLPTNQPTDGSEAGNVEIANMRLRARIDQLEQDLLDAQQETQDRTREASEAQADLASETQRAFDADDRNVVLSQEISDLRRQMTAIDQTEASEAGHPDPVARQQATKQALPIELDVPEVNWKIRYLQEQLKAALNAGSSLKDCQKSLKTAEDRIAELEAELNAVQAAVATPNDCDRRCEAAERQNEFLQGRIADLEQRLDAENDRRAAKAEANGVLRKRVRDLEAQVQALGEQTSDYLANELVAAEARIAQLSRSLDERERHASDLQRRLDAGKKKPAPKKVGNGGRLVPVIPRSEGTKAIATMQRQNRTARKRMRRNSAGGWVRPEASIPKTVVVNEDEDEQEEEEEEVEEAGSALEPIEDEGDVARPGRACITVRRDHQHGSDDSDSSDNEQEDAAASSANRTQQRRARFSNPKEVRPQDLPDVLEALEDVRETNRLLTAQVETFIARRNTIVDIRNLQIADERQLRIDHDALVEEAAVLRRSKNALIKELGCSTEHIMALKKTQDAAAPLPRAGRKRKRNAAF